MEFLHINNERCASNPELLVLPEQGFIWIDCQYEEIQPQGQLLRQLIQQFTQVDLLELHVQDALNSQHPSYFDNTQEYDMLVFRKLAAGEAAPLAPLPLKTQANERRVLQEIVTTPMTFFLVGRLLLTVRRGASKTIEQMQQRLLEYKKRDAGMSRIKSDKPEKSRLPNSPTDLMLRLLNGMVDRYLDLRQPLTSQLDRWQRELLDPRRPFNNWVALLDARIELRKLENLCEEQYDALQELRDNFLESSSHPDLSDSTLVRLNDVMEHINRVLHHARRLQSSLESAVQLHFSAMSHRTNQIMQILTVITAVFAPLTLITGIFGMNFESIPGLSHPYGFWWTLSGMAVLALVLLAWFGLKHYLRRR
jgi:Mg2+ and Co2+ transporter CorA